MFYHNWWTQDTKSLDYDFTACILYLASIYDGFDHTKVHIYSVFGPLNELASSVDGIKLFFTGENTVRAFQEYKDEQVIAKYVDVVAGFFETTSKSVRLPLWMMYYRFYKTGLFTPTQSPSERMLAATLVARHDQYNNRVPLIIDALQHGVMVATTLPPQYLPFKHEALMHVQIGPSNEDKRRFISHAMFNICPENTVTPGYTTEKIFQCIEAGCIPIYNGCKPVEAGILNQERIFDKFSTELVQQSRDIQQLPVWNDDAFYHVCVLYLKYWFKIKQVYEQKVNKLQRKQQLQKVVYTIQSTEEIQPKLKQHWKQYSTLYEPYVQFEYQSKILELEDAMRYI